VGAPMSDLLRTLDPRAGRATVLTQFPQAHERPDDRAAACAALLGRVIRRESSRGMLVLALEDIHAADTVSQCVVRHLLNDLGAPGILWLLTARTCEAGQAVPLCELRMQIERDGFSRLVLGGLRRNEIHRLLYYLLQAEGKHTEAATLARIEALADGNPLYAQELMRVAIDRGATDFREPLPPALERVLMRAIAPLGPQELDVARRAALIGRRFDVGLLRAVVECGDEALARALQSCVDCGLIFEEPGGSGVFRFCRGFVRQALADRVIGVVAAPLHARIADILEARPDATEWASELAYHWSAARVPDKAVQWNETAATVAWKANAYRDAARFYSAALDWQTAGAVAPARTSLYERLGQLLYLDGWGEETAEWFSRARNEWEARGERAAAAHAMLNYAGQAWVDARTAEALHAAAQAAADFQTLGDKPMHACALLTAARFATTLGRPEEALDHVARVTQIARTLDAAGQAVFHEVRGEALALLGRSRDALDDLRRASRAAIQARDSELISQVENNFALVALDLGELVLAQSRHGVALTEARRTGMLWRIGYCALTYAWTQALAGRLDHARDLLWEALETGVTTATFRTKAASVGIWIALALQDRTLLNACADDAAFSLALRSKEMQRIGSVAAAWAELQIARGETAQAQASLREALPHVGRAHRCWPFLLSVARYGSDAEIHAARHALMGATGRPAVRRAYRLLFEAVASSRMPDAAQGTARLAVAAARAMERLGIAWYAALAHEVAGHRDEARRRYARCGDRRSVERLSAPPVKAEERQLTARQAQIALLVAQGRSNRDIAEILHISENTVEHHLSHIFSRTKVRSRAQLAGTILRAAESGPAHSGNPL
jgi:DNA-binding NarL/FixJ family response regulator/tetratricopeptide (TPR) repeat protein